MVEHNARNSKFDTMPPAHRLRAPQHIYDEEEEVEEELGTGSADIVGSREDDDDEDEDEDEDENEDEEEDEEDEDEEEDEEDEEEGEDEVSNEENANEEGVQDEELAAADEDDSGSDVEEVSMATSRRQERQRVSHAQQNRSQEHAERRAAQLRKQSATPRRRHKHTTAQDVDGPEEQDEDTGAAPAAGRLDPALFAAAFAQHDTTARDILKPKRTRRRSAKTAEGDKVVRSGGNTIIRTFDEEPVERSEDAPLQYNALSRTSSLPSAKALNLKKRKLGLGKNDVRATVLDAGRPRPRKERAVPTDDPLGLEDPAFLPGGEFSHTKSAKSRKRQSPRGRVRRDAGPRGAGGRVRAPTGTRTFGPAINFATR